MICLTQNGFLTNWCKSAKYSKCLALEQKIFVAQCHGLEQISYKGVGRHFEQQFPGISIRDIAIKVFSIPQIVENRKKRRKYWTKTMC